MKMKVDLEGACAQLLSLDPDPERQGLQETPNRMAAALRFWTKGYAEDPNDILKSFEDGGQSYDEMVFQGGVPIFSLCEHHLTPFFGVAHIGYIPAGEGLKKIVGLSKLSRVADVFARRFQVQERMTRQIADALWNNLNPLGVGVVLRCRHLCMESRGVQNIGAITYTSALLGCFKDVPGAREEFLRFVALADARSSNL